MTKRSTKRSKPSKPRGFALEGVGGAAAGSTLRLNVFSGRRTPVAAAQEYTLNIVDGNQKQVLSERHKGTPFVVMGIPFHDNLGDRHAISIAAKDHLTVGQAPVLLKGGKLTDLSLMLVPKDAGFNFHEAKWGEINERPLYQRLFANTTEDDYTALIENSQRQAGLACLFNLMTALEQINLIHGSPADLVTELVWDEDHMKQDRLYAWVHKELELQVKRSSDEHGVFAPDAGGGVLHAGSTSSYRQQELDGANLQISFHANDVHPKHKDWIIAEFDIDYYRDPLAHLIFEVFVNHATGARTDPRTVYVLRWAAGLKEGLPNFNPPYCLV